MIWSGTMLPTISTKRFHIESAANTEICWPTIERTKVETDQESVKINSICRFDLISSVKSKNINQNNTQLVLELIAIDFLKNKNDYEINLIFNNNAHIALTTEVIDVRLDNFDE